MTAMVERGALAALREATDLLHHAEQHHAEQIQHAVEVGCAQRDVADAAGLRYDALRMRLVRMRKAARSALAETEEAQT